MANFITSTTEIRPFSIPRAVFNAAVSLLLMNCISKGSSSIAPTPQPSNCAAGINANGEGLYTEGTTSVTGLGDCNGPSRTLYLATVEANTDGRSVYQTEFTLDKLKTATFDLGGYPNASCQILESATGDWSQSHSQPTYYASDGYNCNLVELIHNEDDTYTVRQGDGEFTTRLDLKIVEYKKERSGGSCHTALTFWEGDTATGGFVSPTVWGANQLGSMQFFTLHDEDDKASDNAAELLKNNNRAKWGVGAVGSLLLVGVIYGFNKCGAFDFCVGQAKDRLSAQIYQRTGLSCFETQRQRNDEVEKTLQNQGRELAVLTNQVARLNGTV